ncbi:MFAP1-like protein [Mya arenaria]|uniref:MFAP1-like protein n=1 Tax=Mya arenaria TaxID=6604 RepID=A0ABY7E105_MYAAR|nr:MFAP1-like protein [Mya arenaria]
MESSKPSVPILSTAGAVPVRTEKGVSMQKVKVNRYVTGKRPDYAPDYSSDSESDEDFIRVKKTTSTKPGPSHEEDEDEGGEDMDPRLRRLMEARKSRIDSDEDSEDDDRVARHRRQVIEPEVIAEGTDSEDERVRRHDDDESSEEEELDDEEIEKRRNLLRQRALQRKQEEEVLDIEDDKVGESDEESSEYEEYTDSEEETGPRLKPVFVRKKDRFSVQEKERNEAKMKEMEVEAKKMGEERRKQTLKMIEDERRRELEAARNTQDACDQLESGDENDEEAYESWKVRELRRLKRDREEREGGGEACRVKNFGRSGRTKYTHLVDQDTTSFESPWVSETAMNVKFHSQKGGGMKQIFDRPSQKKKK